MRGGAVTAGTPSELAEKCVQLLGDGQQLSAMSQRLEALGMGQAARRIYETLMKESPCG